MTPVELLRTSPVGSVWPRFKAKEYGCVPPVIWTGIEAGEPAGELGSVALLVKTSGVWAWAELRAAAIAKRKKRRMVAGGVNLVKILTERWRMLAGDFNLERNLQTAQIIQKPPTFLCSLRQLLTLFASAVLVANFNTISECFPRSLMAAAPPVCI
jgi:hypothetical protein